MSGLEFPVGIARPHTADPRTSVIERVTEILYVFLTGPLRLQLEDITAATGLPRTSTHRLFTQLVEHR